GALQRAAQRVGQKLRQVVASQRREHDVLQLAASLANRVELTDQRMRGADLVIAIGSDEQKMLQVRAGQQILDQIQRGGIEPLQVVQEQGQRMLPPGEHPDQAPEDQLEASLCFLRRQLGHWRLLADDVLELGDE